MEQNPVTASFTKLTLREISARQGTNIAGVPIGDVPLVYGLTIEEVDNLYTKLGNGEKITVDDAAPAVQAALGVLHDPSQAGKQLQQAALSTGEKVLITKLSKIPALKGIPLQDLAKGNWQSVITNAEQIQLAGIGEKVGPILKKLPVNQIVPIVGNVINGNWDQVRKRAQAVLLEKGTNIALSELYKAVPELKDLPLGAVPDLVNQPIEQALPKIADLAIEEIPGAKDELINSVPGLSEIPIDKLPFDLAFSFLAGDVFARFDIAYSGVEGPEEPSVNHALSGGTEDQKFRPIKCTLGQTKNQRADNCPHFEMRKFISSPLAQVTGDDDIEGKQWVQGHSKGKNGQGVKGGKGMLKWVNGGWEPAGINPFGTGSYTKFVLKNITEYPDKPSTAELHLAIQVCVPVPIIGEQCTPHFFVIPTPFTVREGGLFLVASRRSLPAEIAKFRDRALTAAGLNQVYCDPDQIIATAGQSDAGSSSPPLGEAEAFEQMKADAQKIGIGIDRNEKGSLILVDDTIEHEALSWVAQEAGTYGFDLKKADDGTILFDYTGQATASPAATATLSNEGFSGAHTDHDHGTSTHADPDHNLRQYLARIAIGESTGGTNWKPNSKTGAYGIYQFTPETRNTVIQRTGLDGWTRDRAVAAQAAVEWIKIIGAEEGVDLMAAIQRGDFALADRVLSPLQFTSLPGGPEESAVWSNPANFEKYGPTGDASTNEPIGVASSGLPCKPSAIASAGNVAIRPDGDGVATGQLRNPLPGYSVTSEYGYRRHPVTGVPGTFHAGIDLGAPTGSPVYAADGGTVDYAGFHPGGHGNLVVIYHGNGLATWYAHNSAINVRTGQPVTVGDKVAEVGSTGLSTGPHLDFGVRTGYTPGQPYSGQHHNPRDFVKF